MLLGYNTNGLAHHRPTDALDLLAREGYQSVALTLDCNALDPYQDASDLDRAVGAVRERLDRHALRRVVETGARFLLNPHRKHDPTMLDPDPARRALRLDFLKRSIDLAQALEADAVSLWSGALTERLEPERALDRLAVELARLLEHAADRGVVLAFEPEPGMFIDTFARFAALDERVDHPLFQLTVDIGHVHCLEPSAAHLAIAPWVPRIRNVHIEDMVRGVHEHLPFGAGTIDFPPILAALRQGGYRGALHVELSRSSAEAVEQVRSSAAFLRPLLGNA